MWYLNLRCCNVFAVLMPFYAVMCRVMLWCFVLSCVFDVLLSRYVVVCRVALLRSSHSLLFSRSYVHDVRVCVWCIACYVCMFMVCMVHNMCMVRSAQHLYGVCVWWMTSMCTHLHSLTHCACIWCNLWQVYTVCCVACVCWCVYDAYVYVHGACVWCTVCVWCNDMFMVCVICTVLYCMYLCVCVWWVAGDKCMMGTHVHVHGA